MSNLKEIRNRINSITSTIQITNAMKMVSVTKLKKVRSVFLQVYPYFQKLQDILKNITPNLELNEKNIFFRNGNSNTIFLIVLSSNKGLCGNFNSSILKKVNSIISENCSNKNIKILALGKKVGDALIKLHTTLKIEKDHSIWTDIKLTKITERINKIMTSYLNNEFYKVVLVYNHFINPIDQKVVVKDFLPIRLTTDTSNLLNLREYIFEPYDKEKILKNLIPKILKTHFYKILLDSLSSEHGARMTAMYKATDNANTLKNELLLEYNKARQSAITKEILEIISGANALEY